MGKLRALGVGILGVVLVVTLVSGGVVFGAHQTVLDPGYVSGTIEEEGGYELAADRITNQLTDGQSGQLGAVGTELGVNTTAILGDVVTPGYVANQSRTNIGRAYAYLHGNTDTLSLGVDLEPLKQRTATEVAAYIRDQEPHELASLLALEEVTAQTGLVSADIVARLDAGPESYTAAKAEFEAAVREQVLTRLVDRTMADASNDELLALVIQDYDPDEYTAEEKQAMVDDRRGEIRAALADRIEADRREDLQAGIDTAKERFRTQVTAQPLPLNGHDDLQQGARALRGAVLDALTTDLGYAAYRDQSRAAIETLADGVEPYVEAQFAANAPSDVSISSELSESNRRQLETARTGVQWLDRLAIILPALALLCVGLIGYLLGSLWRTMGAVGWSLLIAGLPLYAGSRLARSTLSRELPAEREAQVLDALIRGVFGAIQANALACLTLGVLLLGGALGKRYAIYSRDWWPGLQR